MKRFDLAIIASSILFLAISGCKEDKTRETILRGNLSLLCDETFSPIIEDQIAVFESDYPAKITLVSKSEAEVVNALLKDSARVAILSRELTPQETAYFANKKITPRVTNFATDAIALIRSKSATDTLIDLGSVVAFAQGKQVQHIKGLVFDNLNSGTYRAIATMAGLKEVPSSGIYSFTSNREAMEYVAKNPGMIGVIGYNWLTQPNPDMEALVSNLTVLSVKGEKAGYFQPTQNNLAEGNYPLARPLFLINCQGAEGLGMGFASFIAGERGQRIILKSGLLPVRIPSRNVIIRNTVE